MADPVLYRVTASSLNVRAAPSITAAVLGWCRRDDLVTWVSTSGDGYWLEVAKGALRGWCSQKYLSLSLAGPPAPATFPWMDVARAELGVKELPGDRDNPRILAYLRSTSLPGPLASHDETAWCSAFVNWCVERSGFEGTDSAWARSWLRWGRDAGADPPIGAIVVMQRPPDPDSGHVGFLVEKPNPAAAPGDRVVGVLGGNQSNAVCVSSYRALRVLGYRLPGA